MNDVATWVNDHPFVWALYGVAITLFLRWWLPKAQGSRYLVTKHQYAIVFSRRLVPRDKVLVITVRRSDDHEPDWSWHTEPDPLCEDEPPARWTVNQYDDHAI